MTKTSNAGRLFMVSIIVGYDRQGMSECLSPSETDKFSSELKSRRVYSKNVRFAREFCPFGGITHKQNLVDAHIKVDTLSRLN